MSSHIQSWKTIGQKMREIERENQFSTQISGNFSRLIWRNVSIFNPKPILFDINLHTKFEVNRPTNARDRAQKQTFYINQGQ